jgi:hypothetical protein
MTDNDLRIKVAELRGWRKTTYRALEYSRGYIDAEVWTAPDGSQHDLYEDDSTGDPSPFPDYPNDLNACHEFERALTAKQCVTYEDALTYIWKRGKMHCPADGMQLHATARQRCEAFVETMEAK